jgi:hypothetical protein
MNLFIKILAPLPRERGWGEVYLKRGTGESVKITII